ncbi:MAG: threonylcarbamoyl-AMP synthase [Bacteroidaceae bacterium]|jgi:L-threonylcarbamoyladenylate synthase|nr:threonylcarbamoyl-AMP synthase [Bacteroidales bacterium]MBQ3121649.1 threonylcarbamoyl-AMP synthase [Bacteroidaceae bacterium]MBQ3152617.1 threonylcarbamoyl-AMP synthase [Bacteroidaceae bacterium]MBR4294220.1 threonylcarbamoyl-AMP synthase [Bacteroidaceae bacterium]MBR6805075.1 threonylcarbamoyl-AMP synthase [Bacteroidaceae bacterium]
MGTIADEAKRAIEVMRKGGVILYPTDTVWGIGCDATNEEAVKRIYEIKKRTDNKAMLLLVDSPDRIVRYVSKIPHVAWDLMELTTKPLTIIYDGARNLAPSLVAEDGSIGIRVTAELFSKELCYRFQKAVVSTSANISGEPTPRYFAEIDPEIIEAVDYVVKYRHLEKGSPKPSSIIKLTEKGEVTVIRQ